MGEAKRRGTFEQRREQSIRLAFEAKRKDIIYESEKEKEVAEQKLQNEIEGDVFYNSVYGNYFVYKKRPENDLSYLKRKGKNEKRKM